MAYSMFILNILEMFIPKSLGIYEYAKRGFANVIKGDHSVSYRPRISK